MVNAKTWNPAQIDQAIRRLEGIIRSGSYNPAELNQLLNQLGEPGYINTWNPAELDHKLRTLLHDLLSWKTATGNPIQLRTNNGGLVQSCEVTFSPIQSGTGDPAPDNIRPISGRDSLHLYIDTEQTETPEKTYTATFSDTVYNGNYEFVSGKGKETWKITTISDLEWYYSSNGYFYSYISGKASGNTNIISSSYKTSESATVSDMANGDIKGNANNANIYIKDSRATTVEEFLTLSGSQTIACELATPIEIELTPEEEIELLTVENVLWTDGDSIEITYKKLLLPSDVEELSKNKKIKEKPKTTRSKKKKEE